MENFTPISSFLGGILIGISSFALLYFNGKISGISGILERGIYFWQDPKEHIWAFWFLVGLVLGGEVILLLKYPAFSANHPHPLWMIFVGGLLVGFGTRLGGGCTSGHGVCGLGRLSIRSLVAVLVFMFTAMVTVYLIGVMK
ncbi:YeeE/YedE family protein [Leptospira sp. GIMC2001]|uniref:YeeE/YedE family protein n=1 Tax=Leptospira sp. GIMC2001 TaxID=1513297 RepID=UPI0023492E7F|nr:YeeE/YedE family protein [Leptospira sp. GIMC2001]WCL50082.1 YeeE/YedE family protein [Leptospira sp. GIMC2001]